jgi:putative transposase
VRWTNSGVWERVFHALVRGKKNPYLMLDSTIARAHQQAATSRKK